MVYLKRLRVTRFRHVAAGTELRFDPVRNVVLGRNGAGKTTLLDLVAGATAGNLALFAREAFELDFDLEVEDVQISATVRNEPRREFPDLERSLEAIGGEVGVATEAGDAAEAGDRASADHYNFSAEVGVSAAGKRYSCALSRTSVRVSIDGKEVHSVEEQATLDMFLIDATMAVLGATDETENRLFLPATQKLFALKRNLGRLDESLETFDSLTRSQISFRTDEKGVGVHRRFIGNELVKAARAAFMEIPGDKTSPLTLRGVPFLQRAAALFGYASCFVTIPLRRKNVNGAVVNYHYGSMIFCFESADGSVIGWISGGGMITPRPRPCRLHGVPGEGCRSVPRERPHGRA